MRLIFNFFAYGIIFLLMYRFLPETFEILVSWGEQAVEWGQELLTWGIEKVRGG